MAPMTWRQIYQGFLSFFAERGHVIVPSSSLVPAGDPTLLFTNAGMVQFKDVFLGRERRPYDRAVTVQKCMRVSGHHNDLETVGLSPRHHTFFLMCGNFAFGAYFKPEAVRYAWELVTGVYGIDPERLRFTVYMDDDVSFDAWRERGVPADRIYRMGERTNFWMMGPVGPVGPNSEIHFDWGPEACTCGRADCGVALDNDCGRWLEIWNLVFMQYDQAADGTRTPLARPGVDTGMGLERMVSVLQDAPATFDTDLFAPIMDRIQALLGHDDRRRAAQSVPYRVIADHARAAAFLIADGVMPGNEGRAYVLRMIMRRAVRYGRRAGLERPFLHEVSDAVAALMGEPYPELAARREFIRRTVLAEEERFGATLATGLTRLDEAIAVLPPGERVIPGEVAFRLYDTFGFPLEMTRDVARERALAVDEAGFEAAMARQRERARAAGGFEAGEEARNPRVMAEIVPTEFLGDKAHRARGRILALLRRGERVEEAAEGEEVQVVLDRTPFYPEGGGQVGDTGRIGHRRGEVEVADTQRAGEGIILHLGRVARGTVRVGDAVRAEIDSARRRDILRNHTATHLLHRALHEVLGEHARQAGSLVAPDRLRFDFTHRSALTDEEREAIERRVNEQIFAALPVRPRWMSYDEAIRRGAMALFGEKYGERVRVVEIDGYSRELCGGTHLSNTAQIGLLKIVAEGSAAAGIRRIEAVTGRGMAAWLHGQEALVREVADALKVAPAEVPARVRRLAEQVRVLEREVSGFQRVSQSQDLDRLIAAVREVEGIQVLAARVDGFTHDGLRRVGDALRERLPSGVFVLGGAVNGRTNLVVMVTPDLIGRGLRADGLVREVAAHIGGSGGGRADLAQAGGREVERLDEALAAVPELVRRTLAASPR
ncbi:MAG: alanine--tRNA ligase [Armatimonadetes bacterium]|nr:alanine--tRNA ligase [Armatimonadota bacterium]